VPAPPPTTTPPPSLHDALPILTRHMADGSAIRPSRGVALPDSHRHRSVRLPNQPVPSGSISRAVTVPSENAGRNWKPRFESGSRSEEHTSELQSLRHLVCRLLL